MEAQEYRELRKQVGTQGEVAKSLGVTRETINRRESGNAQINGEAALAIQKLSEVSPDNQQHTTHQ